MAVTKKMLVSDKQLKWLILYNKTKKRLKNHELIKLIPKLIKLFYCEFKLRDWSELNNRKKKKKEVCATLCYWQKNDNEMIGGDWLDFPVTIFTSSFDLSVSNKESR